MTTPSRHRLLTLRQRYANAGSHPAGESFLNAFKRFQRANRESLLDITMVVASSQLLLSARSESVDPLLLKAIYDTNPSMSETRLFSLDDEALMGAINTAKGKYFEYLVVERLNAGEQVGPLLLHEGQHAVLAESMTQPRWDMQIVDDHGHVIDYLQLMGTSRQYDNMVKQPTALHTFSRRLHVIPTFKFWPRTKWVPAILSLTAASPSRIYNNRLLRVWTSPMRH